MAKNNYGKKQWERETKMANLIRAAMQKFEPYQLLDMMYNKCCNREERERLKEEMRDTLCLEGGIFVKVESLQQQEKISDFISREIYPSYNEQQANIFQYY